MKEKNRKKLTRNKQQHATKGNAKEIERCMIFFQFLRKVSNMNWWNTPLVTISSSWPKDGLKMELNFQVKEICFLGEFRNFIDKIKHHVETSDIWMFEIHRFARLWPLMVLYISIQSLSSSSSCYMLPSAFAHDRPLNNQRTRLVDVSIR